MSIWKLFSRASKATKLPKTKKAINYKGLTIKLYEHDWKDTEIVCNIEAFASDGTLAWIIEPPTHSNYYWDMQMDEDSDELEADSGSGHRYTINPVNGKIIRSKLIK